MNQPKMRLQSIDGHLKIMTWNEESETWDLDTVIIGDFDMTFTGALKYESSIDLEEKEDE